MSASLAYAQQQPAGTDQTQTVAATAPIPIRSRAELDAYLQAHARILTPLDSLSAGAKERFLGSLVFGDRGLGGFATDDLAAELDPEEIHGILALFGAESYATVVKPSGALRRPGMKTGTQAAEPSDIERRFNLFYKTVRSHRNGGDAEHADNVGRHYDALFAEVGDSAVLRLMDDADLKLTFRAAATAAMETSQPQHIDASGAALAELQERHLASDNESTLFYRSLLVARRFGEARKFAARHSEVQLDALPTLRDDAGTTENEPRTVWIMEDDGQTLSRRPINLEPLQIIVIAGCHFSEDAARDISRDPVLGPIFHRHARWFSLPPGQESIGAVREWNRDYPQARMEMLHDRAEWPMFERWVMPTFHIFKGGRIIESVSGWPPQPTRQHLLDALRRAGLLEGSASIAP